MNTQIVSASESKPDAQKGVRRDLRFETLADILAEAETIASMPATALGKWTPAQNIDHVRRLIRISHAGTDVRMNWAFRAMGRLLKSRFLRSPFKPGLKTVDTFLPPTEIGMDEAIKAFRGEIKRAVRPNAMSHPSPFLGQLTHEEWEQLHCRHAEHHFGYIVFVASSG